MEIRIGKNEGNTLTMEKVVELSLWGAFDQGWRSSFEREKEKRTRMRRISESLLQIWRRGWQSLDIKMRKTWFLLGGGNNISP